MSRKKIEIISIFFIIFVIVSAITLNSVDLKKLQGSITTLVSAGTKDRIHFINIGAGDSILVESQGKYGVIDAGGVNTYKYLEQVMGSNKLSFIILTHSHGDHKNGMLEVINKFANSSTTLYIGEEREATQTGKLEEIRSSIKAKNGKIVEFCSEKSGNVYTPKVKYYVGNSAPVETSGISRNQITLNNFKINILNY